MLIGKAFLMIIKFKWLQFIEDNSCSKNIYGVTVSRGIKKISKFAALKDFLS
jgi:hypothetical protein